MLHPNLNNGDWYVAEDSFSPCLSKSSLGLFLYHVLSVGAYIGEILPFDYKYHRSLVLVTVYVYMNTEMKEKIESNTVYRFRFPPNIKLN